MSTLPFAELNAQSNFSFLYGASHPEEMVEQAEHYGYQAIAITDDCSLSGVVRAHQAAEQRNINLIIGSQFTTDEQCQLVVLAKNLNAYQQLCRFITQARKHSKKGSYQLSLEQFDQGLDQCLVLVKANKNLQAAQLSQLKQQLKQPIYLLLHNDLSQPVSLLDSYRQLAKQHQIECVASINPRMHLANRKKLADILDAIRQHSTVQQAGFLLSSNAERRLLQWSHLQQRYLPEELTRSTALAKQCTFNLKEIRYQYPKDNVPKGYSAQQYLRQLVEAGIKQRFGDNLSTELRTQIEHELALIRELHYEHYFLTIYDIVAYARRQEILCQGRGSAANSVVCYCLNITEVNPQQVGLLFERFISKERDEPPDIDVDFEHQRREEVIQYIYNKYGRDRAALAASIVTYRTRSAINEIGKALAIPAHILHGLNHNIDWRDGNSNTVNKIVQAGLLPENNARSFAELVSQLRGFPRHLSQHVGGFVIAQDKLCDLVPIENAAMPDRTIIQWDKDDLEALHLMKVDVLALGMLSAIRRCLASLSQREQRTISLSDIPQDDKATYDMLCQGDSVGIFQVESRAQISMLPRLKPRNYYDLVIEVAIVRPGPIQGDMVHPYLRRRNGEETVDYPSPEVESVLARTLGVPIFQEQVIKLAMVAAGFSGGEADQLRRAMASWKRNGKLAYFKDKLINGMQARGYPADFAERVFSQIQGFGEYGFPESHSASFALLVYISSWLKCHEPAAFCCALLNSQPMGFYSPSQLIQDIQRHGVTILPIDINQSDWEHSLDYSQHAKGAIRLGLKQIKGLNKGKFAHLLANRPSQGFSHLNQLTQQLDKTSLESLATADAFACLAGHRHQTRWQMSGTEAPLPLFDMPKEAEVNLTAPSEIEDIKQDYLATRLSLRRHPMHLLREHQALKNCYSQTQLHQCKHGQLVKVAGLVVGRQRPGSSADVTFVTLEDETGNSNVIVWSATAKAQRQALISSRLLKVHGRLERCDEVIHIIAGKLEDCSWLLADLSVRSRDFH
ncbi:error-prone DNA polymerase [Agarivorans sp. 1_MG-2023]|uniref:error-prone DNA polymerase n=1 Tax=Agarivorans sp. 1_MG-2023 TaxID=3062634 RepID=UPI0026E47B18|nr:error-prone DNA polymerase [Agarivorans sp. 1_MG-2023]MDO6762076.1 error-prone DNA polymerase [Agarivorans sp. 1_MG-2023]